MNSLGNKNNIYNKISNLMIMFITNLVFFSIKNRNFFVSLAITMLFYLPALKHGSLDAGFLYGGDVIGWYLPALIKTHTLIHSLNFTAIDFSVFNGSSDFFLSPNFFAYHPLVIIFSLLFLPEATDLHQHGQFLVLLIAFHSFIAFYFSLKLFIRFFDYEFSVSALIATCFTFSHYMVNALGEPPFILCTSILPWTIYATLAYSNKLNFRQLTFACLPILIGLMSGYIPLAVATLLLSVVLIGVKILYINDEDLPLESRLSILLTAYLPYIYASVIAGPYLYSVYSFHKETSSAGFKSLFFSAHQLAQLPQSLLQIFSQHFAVPGPSIEFSLVFGFIAISIAVIFLISPRVTSALDSNDWKLFKISALIYFATVLATFGDYSVISDFVYYLIPQIGGMHIYQRFLLPAQLMFAIMLALMLKALVKDNQLFAIRFTLVLITVTTFVVAYLVAYKPMLSKELGLNNFLVFELFLANLFLCALTVPSKNFIYFAAIVLILLPVFDRMYDYSLHGHTLEEQRKRQPITLNEKERLRLVSYLKRFGNKNVIKYVDITPMWGPGGTETFPKVFPYFVLQELPMSSYGGFTFYLSARAEYMKKMPVIGDVVVSPDWDLIENSGADFVVALESDINKGALNNLVNKVKNEDIYKLNNNVVLVPLRISEEKNIFTNQVLYDNGYFKILPEISHQKLPNIAAGKSARQSSFGGGDARLAVDGNTDGDFNHNSVSHSGRDINAWLDIDLEAVEPIDTIKIWNRTDCCGERLHDYWIFISDTPFLASDTASILRTRTNIWSQINATPNPKSIIKTPNIHGRYVRLQLSGTQPIDESFLSLAEVEVFRSDKSQSTILPTSIAPHTVKINKFETNFATYLYLDFDTNAPSTIQYLFWDNPRLKYYLNGNRVNFSEKEGLRGIDVPIGHNTVEIKYRHWPLTLFWFFYTAFGFSLLLVLIPVRFQEYILKKINFSRLLNKLKI